MNTKFKKLTTAARALALVALACLVASPAQAQTTDGGTQIQNRASASYSDGSNTYQTVSEPVTVIVANVTGLAITPDAGTIPSVVAGKTNVDFSFVVTNTGNFSTQVRFLPLGGSYSLSGPATVQGAVIDTDGTPGYSGGDTDIKNNAGQVLSAALARNASLTVIVRVNVNAGAASGSNINVRLGDAAGGAPSYDNQTVAPANLATAKVRTDSSAATSAPANGETEARGDITATVDSDAQLELTLNYPAGPVALGSNITYTFELENTGQRAAKAQTLLGAPPGSQNGVFVVAPVPQNTTFVSATPPAGVTVLYTNSPLANSPLAASTVWTAVAPAGVTRVAFNLGNTFAAGATAQNLQMVVNVNTNANASNPIYQIGDAFGLSDVNDPLTDQSGDALTNEGDGNANFNEPRLGTTDLDQPLMGWQSPTTLTLVGTVLVGPENFPDAVGPNSTNDDYTNRASNAGLAGVAPGGSTTAGGIVNFTNTVRNTGNGNDTFTLTATAPVNFGVEVSTNGGTSWTTLSGGGSTTLAINFGQQANILVRVNVPAGITVLTGYDVVVRATSQNSNTNYNETIDRVYTGFLRLTKTFTVINTTGVGDADDPVPGAHIQYVITYENITTALGTNNSTLTATNIVISEEGDDAPNNWATYTTQVTSPAPSDTNGGTITDGDTTGAVTSTTTWLKDSVPSLGPGQSGSFTFRRRIN